MWQQQQQLGEYSEIPMQLSGTPSGCSLPPKIAITSSLGGC
jgi:hypothetical protein